MIIIMDPEFHWDFHVNRVPFPLQTCIPNSIPVNILREIYQLLCKLYTLYTQFKLLHYLLEIFQKQTFLHSAVMFFSIIVISNSINYEENLCESNKKSGWNLFNTLSWQCMYSCGIEFSPALWQLLLCFAYLLSDRIKEWSK